MIDREHDLPITKQAEVLRISRGSVYYLPRSVSVNRSNRRKCATQDGRRLRRYARRWLVERFFAWI